MKYIFICFILAFFISCSDKKTELTETQAVKQQLDTLAIGNKVYQTQDLADTNFVFEEFNLFDPSDSAYIEKEKNLVNRIVDTLFLRCDNGKTVKLKNNRTDGDDMMAFDFKYFNKDINTYVVSCSLYESFNVWLINKQTGDSLITIGYPIVSPNKKQFICANLDLEAAFTTNGFELFNYTDNSCKTIGLRELSDWGPEEIMWKNDTTLVVKVLQGEGDGKYRSYYKALYIKQSNF